MKEIARVGEGKKIYLLEYVTEEQLIVVLSGKQRHVRLVPVRALDGDEVEWIKVAETKGCITLTTGIVRRSPLTYCLCVAIKKQVRHVLCVCNINIISILVIFFFFFDSEYITNHYL